VTQQLKLEMQQSAVGDRSIVISAEVRTSRVEATHINKQVLPHAPSPTMTSLRRISAMVIELVCAKGV
jgi:hypothetical protein